MPRGRPRGSVASDKPRGRMTAYAFFVQTCREEHKKLHPDETVKFELFSRQCSDRWKTMSEIEKEKFHEMATKDKERYIEEMKGYVAPLSLGRRGRRPRGMKKMKDPNKPKRALSAFLFYSNDERPNVRAANPDFSVGEVAKELGRQWGELNENEKAKYEKQAEQDRARYDREMVDYRSGGTKKSSKAENNFASNGHTPHANNDDDEEDEEMDEGSDEDDEDDDASE